MALVMMSEDAESLSLVTSKVPTEKDFSTLCTDASCSRCDLEATKPFSEDCQSYDEELCQTDEVHNGVGVLSAIFENGSGVVDIDLSNNCCSGSPVIRVCSPCKKEDGCETCDGLTGSSDNEVDSVRPYERNPVLPETASQNADIDVASGCTDVLPEDQRQTDDDCIDAPDDGVDGVDVDVISQLEGEVSCTHVEKPKEGAEDNSVSCDDGNDDNRTAGDSLRQLADQNEAGEAPHNTSSQESGFYGSDDSNTEISPAKDSICGDVQESPDSTVTTKLEEKVPGEAGARAADAPAAERGPSHSTSHVPRQPRQRMGSYGTPPPATASDDEAAKQQYVVNVHVNPGETFSVCVSDQVQLIQGPATVRMVSNNGPPLPMPMQVPPGHMVQQIIDENGILTNVILSSQPPGIMAPPMMVGYYGGPNGAPISHMYSPFGGPPYSPFPTAPYAMHHPHPNGLPPVPPRPQHVHPMTGAPPHGPHIDVMSPIPLNHMPLEGRLPMRGKGRLPRKVYKHKQTGRVSHLLLPQNRTIPNMNGVSSTRLEPHSESSSSEDQELEEERRLIREQLSRMPPPKVIEIEERSALIVLTPPDFNHQEFDVDPADFHYELFLSEHKDSKFNMVYSGDAIEITLRDLKPATEYFLKVHSLLDDLKGNMAECVNFRTACCEPDAPQPPKLHARTMSTITVKWTAPVDNGAKVTSYVLEYDQGHGGAESAFAEVYSGSNRQHRITKLAPLTSYSFRLAAVNSFGRSEYSVIVSYSTTGTVPSQPDPPMLSERFVSALTVSWIRRRGDDYFTLDMDDEATGNGFLRIYSGSDLSYTVSNLQRNTEYKFRLQACNDEGSSPWSDIVRYRTLCDRPRPPPKPQVKGKVHPHSFRIFWDPPRDSGGVEISQYLVQMDCGAGFELVYTGNCREYLAEDLLPGRTYRVSVACVAADKQSDWSEMLSIVTQCVPPGVCQPVYLHGHAHATSLHVRWGSPDFTGGSSSIEYELLMTYPDKEMTTEVYRGPNTEAVVHSLLPGRPYMFQVRALNHAGAGPWSESVEIKSGANVPDSPPVPTIVCKSPHVAQISWCEPASNGAPVTEFRLEWQQRVDLDFSLLYSGLSLTAEVSGLSPSTTYSFRVQAVNSAGAGPCSVAVTCITPPSSPAAVTCVELSATATSVHVAWRPPSDNGSRITAYHIAVDERPAVIVDSSVLEYVVEDLQPETAYRVRVQAVNAIGHSAFSTPMKIVTRSLPPLPPIIECVAVAHNSLKLKWRDSRYLDLAQYTLEMQRDDGSFQCIYRGSGHSHKVVKLSELTQYSFRIGASNDAGSGPYSSTFSFTTIKAPPPPVKAPKVSSVTIDSCVIEWLPLKPMSDDAIVYVVQMSSVHDPGYRQVYRGSQCTFRMSGLVAGMEYRVRVHAVRQTVDGSGDLIGAPSMYTNFTTLPQRSTRMSGSSVLTARTVGVNSTSSASSTRWTDQQWAMLLLLSFTVCAILIAFLAQQLISYVASGTGDERPASTYELSDDDSPMLS